MVVRSYTIDDLKRATVRILNEKNETVGTGFFIREDGYLITCHHVIYQLAQLAVQCHDGQTQPAEWCEVLSDPEKDIAILKVALHHVSAVPIINPPTLSLPVTILGFPRSKDNTFDGFPVFADHVRPSTPVKTRSTYGSSPSPPVHQNKWNVLPTPDAMFLSHQIDAPVDPGTSGGPVFVEALNGVVGVIQASNTGVSYAIRWKNITDQLDRLGLEPQTQAVCRFLEDIERTATTVTLFHAQRREVNLKDYYIPVQVTLKHGYRPAVETSWAYAESDAESQRAYGQKREEESQTISVPWEQAKQEAQRLIVLADPGVGKSSLLRMEAAITAAKERQRLLQREQKVTDVTFPIRLRLTDLAESAEEIQQAIPKLLSRDYPHTASTVLPAVETQLQVGKCLLLFDAYDEVSSAKRVALRDKLMRFAHNFNCHIITTCRIVGYDGAFLPGAKEVEIVPFSPGETWQYITTRITNAADTLTVPSVSAEDLLQEIDRRPYLQGLAQNPLLLSLLCSLYQEHALVLPARRSQVYAHIVRHLLGPWSLQRRHQEESRVEAKLHLLEDLAYGFSCQEIFSESSVLEQIRSYLQSRQALAEFHDATTVLTESAQQDGILTKLDPEGDQYLFLHRTFQEYFTASYLRRKIENNQEQGLALATAHLWDFEWHETLCLLAGLLMDPIPFLQAILAEKDDIFSSLLLLAGRCVAECGEETHPVSSHIVEQLYTLWHRYPEFGFITSVIASLGRGTVSMFNRLQKALQDKNKTVVWHVIVVLKAIGGETAVAVLRDALHDADRFVIEQAIQALGAIGSEAAVAVLRDALLDENPYVKVQAAAVLKAIGGETAVAVLRDALHDADWFVIKQAIQALGAIGSEAAVAVLRDALHDADWSVIGEAIQALGAIGSEAAVAVLRDVWQHHEHWSVRREAFRVLGAIGSEAAVAVLRDALQGETPFFRDTAVAALWGIAIHAALPILHDSLQGQGWSVRQRAVEALRAIGGEATVPALHDALQDKNPFVKVQAAAVLGTIGNEAAWPALRDALQNRRPFIRRWAVAALRVIGGQILVDLMPDKDQDVRQQAVEALCMIGVWIGNEAAMPALRDALQDEKRRVRLKAIEALMEIGDETAMPALRDELQDPFVRKRIAYFILQCNMNFPLENRDTIKILERLLQCGEKFIIHSGFDFVRMLAIRLHKEQTPLIPIYPEVLRRKRTFLSRLLQWMRKILFVRHQKGRRPWLMTMAETGSVES